MNIVTKISDLKSLRKNCEASIGFVPTMGFLHEGHRALIQKAQDDLDQVWVSIFVNPTQFNNASDLERYPRDLDRDQALLRSWGVDLLFTPEASEIYADSYRYSVHESLVSKDLCGQNRPGHFEGVLTVVLKFFNLVRPDRAYFGEKDFQQLTLIRGMAQALFLDLEVVSVPTQRLASGLALSSRNARLSEADQIRAAALYQLLNNPNLSPDRVRQELLEKGFEVDYVKEIDGRRFAAASVQGVRLIDNVEVSV